MTLGIYAHALPAMKQDAAVRLTAPLRAAGPALPLWSPGIVQSEHFYAE